VEFEPSHGICLFAWNFCIFVEFCGNWYWPMITFIFQFKYNFAKLSDKTADLLKSADYISNQQNSTATQKKLIHHR